MSSEVALRSKKAKLPRMEEQYSSMNAMEENICYSTLTSFLQKDTSFLTPWSWDPYASRNEASTSTKQNQYIRIPPGSYFSYSVSFLLQFCIINCNNINVSHQTRLEFFCFFCSDVSVVEKEASGLRISSNCIGI